MAANLILGFQRHVTMKPQLRAEASENHGKIGLSLQVRPEKMDDLTKEIRQETQPSNHEQQPLRG